MRKMVGVALNEDEHAQLQQQAAREGCSPAELLRRALKHYADPVPERAPAPISQPVDTRPEVPRAKRRKKT